MTVGLTKRVSRKLTERLTIPMSPRMLLAIAKEAAARQISASELVRRVIERKLAEEKEEAA